MDKMDKLFAAQALLEVMEEEKRDCKEKGLEHTELYVEAEDVPVLCEALKFYLEHYTQW